MRAPFALRLQKTGPETNPIPAISPFLTDKKNNTEQPSLYIDVCLPEYSNCTQQPFFAAATNSGYLTEPFLPQKNPIEQLHACMYIRDFLPNKRTNRKISSS